MQGCGLRTTGSRRAPSRYTPDVLRLGVPMTWRGVLVAAVVAAVAGASAWAALADDKAGWAVLAASLAAVVGAFGPTIVQWARRAARPYLPLSTAADELATTALKRILTNPLRTRLNRRRMPMQVGFRSTEHLGADRLPLPGAPGLHWRETPIEGHTYAVADALRGLPWRQLVVVGEPGAGKSVMAMMLAEQLLTHRKPDEPVPVLLPISSWDPTTESVAQFVGRRISEDFELTEVLALALVAEPRTSQDGLAGWWVMPVPDGLDEIPSPLREVALTAIEDFAASDRPLVLTCRTREFAKAEAVAGVLARAAVVQMQPLTPQALVDFLSDTSPRRQALWRPVIDDIIEQPLGALATALSSPLMAGLAKETFALSDPRELLGISEESQIADRLLDSFTSVAYNKGSSVDDGMPRARLHDYEPNEAITWLTSLAYLGYLDATRDLRWWRLPWAELAVRPKRFATLQAVAVTGTAIVATVLTSNIWSSWPRSIIAGGLFGLAIWLSLYGRLAGRLSPDLTKPPSQYGALLLVALPRIAVTESKASRYYYYYYFKLIELGLYGTVFGATAMLLASVDLLPPGDPDFREAIRPFFYWMQAGQITAILCYWPHPSAARAPNSGPARTLNALHARGAALASTHAVIAAAVFGVHGYATGAGIARWSLPGAAVFAVTGWIAAEATWVRFRLNQAVLSVPLPARPALLPLRLIAFLRDGAHPDRGVLRVNGSTWQFRHARIQDRLALAGKAAAYRRRAGAGDWSGKLDLAVLLREQGSLDELRARAAVGDWEAGWQLVQHAREQGDLDELLSLLRRLADTAPQEQRMALHLTRRQREESGDAQMFNLNRQRRVSEELAALLRSQHLLQELRHRADTGDTAAGAELAALLREQGLVEELSVRADAGDWSAREALPALLRELGQVDELRKRADAEQGRFLSPAKRELAAFLREHGLLEELRQRADAGDQESSREMAAHLRAQGQLEGLRHRADAGDWAARQALAALMRERGMIDELRERADAGDWRAREALPGLLRERGLLEELRRRADADAFDLEASRELATLLRDRGLVEELRRRADAYDSAASRALPSLLREQGLLDELRRRADREGPDARRELAALLRERGLVGELRHRADAGDWGACRELAALLREKGLLDELRRRADLAIALLGRPPRDAWLDGSLKDARVVVRELARLLHELGDLDEARAVLRLQADEGDTDAASDLARLFEQEGQEGIRGYDATFLRTRSQRSDRQ